MAEFVPVLRAAHILFAILWAGAAFYRNLVIGRLLEDDGAAARFFAKAPHEPFMGVTATGTILFGFALMGLNSEAYSLEAIGRGAWILGAGMGFAVAAYAVGIFGHARTGKALRPIASARAAGQAHNEAGYKALVAREHGLGRISTTLIAAALLSMLLFRF